MSSFPNASNCSQQFQNDLTSLEKDAAKFKQDQATAKKAMADAENTALNIDVQKYKGHPDELLIVLLLTVFGTKLDQAYQYQLAVTGDQIQVQSDLSKLTNDIQAAPNAATGTAGVPNGSVEQVAAETDTMQDILSGSSVTATDVQDAIGGTASSFMSANFAKVRKDIYWAGDPESQYNPPEITLPKDPTAADYTYHFVVPAAGAAPSSYAGYMVNYYDLSQNLQGQDDAEGAQEASTILTNSYNQTISAQQSVGTTANSRVGSITSKEKSVVTATSAFAQNFLTLARTSIRNQRPQ